MQISLSNQLYMPDYDQEKSKLTPPNLSRPLQ